MAHLSRTFHNRALTCALALGLTLGAAACGSDSAKEETAAAKTTTTGTAVVTTTTKPMPATDDPEVKAYCETVRDLTAKKVTDQAQFQKAIESKIPAELKDAYATLQEATANPGDTAKQEASASAFAQVIKFNEERCGVSFQL